MINLTSPLDRTGFTAGIERLSKRSRFGRPDPVENGAIHPIPTWNKQHDHNYASMWWRGWHFVCTEQTGRCLSHNLRVWADDNIIGRFHSRDWTRSGLPFIDEEDVYWSGFWFELSEDAELFRVEFASVYFAIGDWEEGFEIAMKRRNSKRKTPNA